MHLVRELVVLLLQLPDPVYVARQPVVEVLQALLLLPAGQPGALGHVRVRVVVQPELVERARGLVPVPSGGGRPPDRLHDGLHVLCGLLGLLDEKKYSNLYSIFFGGKLIWWCILCNIYNYSANSPAKKRACKGIVEKSFLYYFPWGIF